MALDTNSSFSDGNGVSNLVFYPARMRDVNSMPRMSECKFVALPTLVANFGFDQIFKWIASEGELGNNNFSNAAKIVFDQVVEHARDHNEYQKLICFILKLCEAQKGGVRLLEVILNR